MITNDEADRLLSIRKKIVGDRIFQAVLDEDNPEAYTHIHTGEHSRLVGYRYKEVTLAERLSIQDAHRIEAKRRCCAVCEFSIPAEAPTIERRCTKCKCLVIALTTKLEEPCPEGHW